jgi:hypothetical protein
MLRSDTHRILLQTIVASTPEPAQAYRVAAELRDAMEGSLGAALEAALDRAAEEMGIGAATLRLDRLEFRATGASVDEAIARLTADLPRTLVEAIRASGATPPTGDVLASSAELVPDERLWDEILEHALIERRLPWNVQHYSPEESRLALAAAAERLWRDPDLARRLERIAGSATPAEIIRRLTTLVRLHRPSSTSLRTVVGSSLGPRSMSAPLPTLLRLVELGEAADGETLTADVMREACVLTVATAWHRTAGSAGDLCVAASAALQEALTAVDQSRLSETPTEQPPAERRDVVRGVPPSTISPTQTFARRNARLGERVNAAGLVLLHPFLPSFFAHLDLLSVPDRRVPFTAMGRAAAALSFLVTGRDAPFEHELGLIRHLLDVPDSLSVSVEEVRLTDTERSEANSLLASAVSHWTSLGRTSIDGLRNGFLRRSGTLYRSAATAGRTDSPIHDRLVVDSAGHDILLASLPWTISVVKLPWMTKPLMIDWPTP